MKTIIRHGILPPPTSSKMLHTCIHVNKNVKNDMWPKLKNLTWFSKTNVIFWIQCIRFVLNQLKKRRQQICCWPVLSTCISLPVHIYIYIYISVRVCVWVCWPVNVFLYESFKSTWKIYLLYTCFSMLPFYISTHTQIYIYIYIYEGKFSNMWYIYIYIYLYKVKSVTVVEGDPKSPFSSATTPKSRGERNSILVIT